MQEGSKRMEAIERTSRTPVALVGLGMFSLLLWLGTDLLRVRLADQELALTQAASEIRVNISVSHLWLEEYVSGDRSATLTDIWNPIVEARRLADSMLRGGTVGPNRNLIAPLASARDLRQSAARVGAGIEEFQRATQGRLDAMATGKDFGVGTPIDEAFDAVFARLARQAWAFELEVHREMAHRKQRARMLLFSLMGFWMALVASSAQALRWHHRRRRSAEAALRRSELQLLQAQKMEAVGRLAGGLAHDINNYIGAITSQCELVKMRIAPPERVAEKMDLVIATAGKITALIRRLLAFSRPQPVQVETISLNSVVEEVGGMVKRLLGEDLHVETFLAPDLWLTRSDPGQVEQVIVNLLVNAREASPQGGHITIETANSKLDRAYLRSHPAVKEGEYILLAVSDSGSGIAPEIRDQIFDPFFTTKQGGEARGLGLATVYAIVKQNGGHISLYSEVGQGTTFRVYFPRVTDAAPKPVSLASEGRGPLRGSETLLLVEDNDELRGATQGVLEALGYALLPARDGIEALEILERRRGAIDLVISDVVMPGLSGQQIFDRMRSLSPEIRVLFISGYTDNVVLRHGILAGQFDFLDKPFSSERLSRKIREILDRDLPQAAEG